MTLAWIEKRVGEVRKAFDQSEDVDRALRGVLVSVYLDGAAAGAKQNSKDWYALLVSHLNRHGFNGIEFIQEAINGSSDKA